MFNFIDRFFNQIFVNELGLLEFSNYPELVALVECIKFTIAAAIILFIFLIVCAIQEHFTYDYDEEEEVECCEEDFEFDTSIYEDYDPTIKIENQK